MIAILKRVKSILYENLNIYDINKATRAMTSAIKVLKFKITRYFFIRIFFV